MGDPALGSFIDALRAHVVPILVVTALAGTTAGVVVSWLERRAARALRARREKATRAGCSVAPTAGLILEEGPACPSCHSPMVVRVARRGPKAGSRFWGCSNFPSCRQTQKLA